jgi:putative ABC transport system substrate-binding protein
VNGSDSAHLLRRRDFIAALGGAATWPLAARAQERVRRIAVLSAQPADDLPTRQRVKIFQDAIRARGWIEGQNVRFDLRFGGGDRGRIQAYAVELVGLKPDLILSSGSPVTAAFLKATRTVPIVFANIADPVRGGFIASLARPEANVTGFMNHEYSMVGKWLELLREIAPQISRVAIVHDPKQIASSAYAKAIESLAAAQGVAAAAAPVQTVADIEQTLLAFAAQPRGGLIVPADVTTTTHHRRIIKAAEQHGLPAVYLFRYFVAAGGLMSYGADIDDLYRRAADYVDRILRGAKVADLPVQAPTKFQLIINLKTAKALGLAVPPTLLARADEVIE